ncbi:serine hydrolase domain-containing protein [Streptomyces sp. MJP52]|uniref:serine hydrolase domain-containing protein n=1 Tax=Streptomyces sp. MJP52 TaxID=2940555 RepID=UPI002476A865|nr:serine hydrolase domain-containing protein [Streptomyces sp. MJP52]MDH6223667.1 CubicO group peptidase (beta-lactamase class C family) [Streptomyces sp. MJP52]
MTSAGNPLDHATRLPAPGLTLLVTSPDGLATQTCTGSASLELAVPIEENTVFNVGSVAKQITAHLCVRAAEAGLLSLHCRVKDVLPRFLIPDVTVGELVQHHGGVRDVETLLSLVGFRELDHYTADDLLELAYRQRARSADRDHFLYSNTGYLLLAEILVKIHGTDLQQVAEEYIFGPLGMRATRFKRDPQETIQGAAASYQFLGGRWRQRQTPVTLPGPGSLWTTAGDLDRWLRHLSDVWRDMDADRLPYEHLLRYRPSDHPPFTYGPGLYADPSLGRRSVFHYGHEQGFSAAALLTEEGQRIVCLSNHADVPADYVVRAARTEPGRDLSEFLPALPAIGSEPTKAVAQDDARDVHTQLGTYSCGEVPGTLRLTRHAGTLWLWRRGTCDRLVPSGATTFSANGYRVTFHRPFDGGERDQISGFTLDLDRAPGLRYVRIPD